MKKSPVYPKYEINDCDSDYNLHADFSQFLDEAKRNEKERGFGNSSGEEYLVLKTSQEQEKKKKKSWKAFVFPWLKSDNNKKRSNEAEIEPRLSSRCGSKNSSGPVHGRATAFNGKPRRALSGPIMTSLFSPMKKADSEMPYMCLDRLGRPCGADKNYGPLYLVT